MSPIRSAYDRLYRKRRVLAYSLYGGIAGFSYAAAYLLRFEFDVPRAHLRALLWTLPLVLLIRVAFAWLLRLSSGRWRFIATSDVVRLFTATSAGSLVLYALNLTGAWGATVPQSVLLIEWVLTTYATAGLWLSYRLVFERIRHSQLPPGAGPLKRALLVGAGEAGNFLAREMQRSPTGYRLVGLVDDDPLKWGCRIQGSEVIGGTQDLGSIVEAEEVDEIILAIPSAEPDELRRLVEQCEETNVPFKVLPGIAQVLAGEIRISDLRELRIEDLLGREPIDLELPELAEDLRERCVLITGAAGSIGSELSRQVALNRPGRLVVLDQAETDLFFLDMELRESHPDLDLVTVVGDVVDAEDMNRLFEEQRPDRVFHAAAYKHVPLMETNVDQALKNNVLGTSVVAEAAGRHGCGTFVLVSTDKAVRPASAMGASKRLAELVVLELQEEYPATSYGAVRFGNVLGSKGSVIPIFRRQLASGKPLTVTHPEITRYFMTIPEAVQLVLQTSLLPDFRGHIAMLDMGEPVKILDLALNFLRLSGVPPRPERTYRVTGLRPGEKMHEELSAPHEETIQTPIAKVRMLTTSGQTDGLTGLRQLVREWDHRLRQGDSESVGTELRSLFPGLQNGSRPPENASLPRTALASERSPARAPGSR